MEESCAVCPWVDGALSLTEVVARKPGVLRKFRPFGSGRLDVDAVHICCLVCSPASRVQRKGRIPALDFLPGGGGQALTYCGFSFFHSDI